MFVKLVLGSRIQFLKQGLFSENFCNKGALCFFHGADINDRFHGFCATAPRNLAYVVTLSTDVDHLFDVLLGILLKQMTQPLRVWQKFQVLFLGALHVHDVYRVVARLLSGLLSMELSSFVSFEAAWHQPSSFEGCLVLRKPGIVEVFCHMQPRYLCVKQFG